MDVNSLRKMTVAELREEAKKLGDVKGIASMKKDDLVQLIASGGSGAASTDRGGKTSARDLPTLKLLVRELKARRAEASSKGQKSKVMEFNSDLHTLRHRLRRAARRRRKPS
jgi:hypothetical protein